MSYTWTYTGYGRVASMVEGDEELDPWDRPGVRAALYHGDWAPALQAMFAAGWSQTGIAATAGISQAHVSRLATGKTRDPGIATVRALCAALGIPPRVAGLADNNDIGGDDTDRRDFLTTTLGAAASLVVAPGGGDPDEQLVMLTTLSYRRLEQTTPAQAMLAGASGHLGLARQLAAKAQGPAHAARMFAAVSEAAGLVAWLHADRADPAAARHHYKMAVAAAHKAGNSLLPVYMQASLGQYAVSAGDPVQGLRLIRDATGRLPGTAPGTARAWLAAADAVALAHLGNAEALRMVDDAERHATASQYEEPVWPWVYHFDQAKIDQTRLVVNARLERGHEVDALSSRRVRSPKQAAILLVERARLLAAAGEVGEACTVAANAYQLGTQFDSEKVRVAVRDFRTAVPDPAAADLDALMFDTYRGRRDT